MRFGKETCLPERVFTSGGPSSPEDWEGGKHVQSGAGSGMPVGAGLLGRVFLLREESARDAGGKGGLVHSRAG